MLSTHVPPNSRPSVDDLTNHRYPSPPQEPPGLWRRRCSPPCCSSPVRPAPDTEIDASACIRRHHAFALPPVGAIP
jgi:hypothetical protein